jgi:hypothetical protein
MSEFSDEETIEERQESSPVSPALKPHAPTWSLQALKAFLDHVHLLDEVLHLCFRGISMLRGSPGMVKAIAKAEGTLDSKENQEQLSSAQHMAALAQREIESDFAILHSQAAVSLWSSLESLVLDLVADWVRNQPEILNNEPWANLKIKLADYEAVDSEQRAAYLVGLVDQTVAAPVKQGVNRFEHLLATIGLNGAVPGDLGKSLYELQQVRNVIVHKRSIADRKFCRLCPWMKLMPGQEVLVSHAMYNSYRDAVLEYVMELIFRTGEFFGVANMRGSAAAT